MHRLSQYLAYTELVVARVRAETTSATQWKVFGLKDYEMPGPTQIDTEGYTLRNKLKKQLKVQAASSCLDIYHITFNAILFILMTYAGGGACVECAD